MWTQNLKCKIQLKISQKQYFKIFNKILNFFAKLPSKAKPQISSGHWLIESETIIHIPDIVISLSDIFEVYCNLFKYIQ